MAGRAQERRDAAAATTPTPAGWNIKVAFAPMRPALNYFKEGYAMDGFPQNAVYGATFRPDIASIFQTFSIVIGYF